MRPVSDRALWLGNAGDLRDARSVLAAGITAVVELADGEPFGVLPSGADPWKLHQQIRQFGASKDGMPPIFVYEDADGVLEISDGVTRAVRIEKLAPGVTVPVLVIGHYRRSRSNSPCVRDRL